MGLPIIGLGVKVISGGVGAAVELRAARKDRQVKGEEPSASSPSSTSPTLRVTLQRPPVSISKAGEVRSEQSDESSDEAPPPYSVEHDRSGSEPLEKGSLASEEQLLHPINRHSSSDKSFDGSSDVSIEEDEREWELDEVAQDHFRVNSDSRSSSPTSETKKLKRGYDGSVTLDSYASAVLETCPPPPTTLTTLKQPVIIPQRRPGNRARGFVRAYAPILSESGISQETFLSFVKNLQNASSASPILNVVFIGAGIVSFSPEPFTSLGSGLLQAAAGTAIEVQRRTRSNNFLDQMNETLFKPRGLYAMVMSYVPDQQRPVDVEAVDTAAMIAKQTDQKGKFRAGLKTSSAKTYGDVELPSSAMLVFPEVEQAVDNGEGSSKQNVKTSKIIANYYDRRAQAMFAAKNPESALRLPDDQTPHFASRFSDPNDLGGNTSLRALVTGGRIDPDKKRRAQRQEEQAKQRMEQLAQQKSNNKGRGPKRFLKSSVLYLTIVNLPSEHELSFARAEMIKAQNDKS